MGLDMMGSMVDWQACCYDLQEEVARDGFEAVMGVSCEAVLEAAFGLPVKEVTLEGDSLALCALQIVFRWRLERLDDRPLALLVAFTHPLGNALFIGILVRSALGGPVRWKGRDFVGGKAA